MILSFTWGLPLTLAGSLVSLALLAAGCKPKRWNYCVYFEIGENWGGFSLGPFFVKDKTYSEGVMDHEHGHAIQNCVLGFLTPFLVSFPSAIRYWYRKLRFERKGLKPKRGYYDIWFESWATILGMALDVRLKNAQRDVEP